MQPAKDAGLGGHLKNLYNDYVYFWRWALWKLFENSNANGPGIVSFITASSYLRGPGFVGMRSKMREAFDELWIIDLGGDNLGARKTPNVFNIQTPVAIAIGVRFGAPQPEKPAVVHYTRLDADSRDEKLARIGQVDSFGMLQWQTGFSGWMQPLLPQGQGVYFEWPLITEIFPWQHTGVEFKRTWPMAETKDVLTRRWAALLKEEGSARANLFRESGDRRISKSYLPMVGEGDRLPALSSLNAGAQPPPLVGMVFRSFDRQWMIADGRACSRPRPPLWASFGDKQVFMTSHLAGVLGVGPAATVAAYIPERHHFCGRGGKDVIPLWRDPEGTQANVTTGLLEALAEVYAEPPSAEDLFAYAYAVLATPKYVDRFSEELTVPGPRLPITRDISLFKEAVKIGRELVYLHTYGERFATANKKAGVAKGAARLHIGIPDVPNGYPEDFTYNAATRELRVGSGVVADVAPEVFNFTVSGFDVVKSWLSYRMRSGAGKKSSALDDIRPDRWTVGMSQELLQLLWMLEHTLASYALLADLFERIIASPVFVAHDLPRPNDLERKPPGSQGQDDESPVQPLLV